VPLELQPYEAAVVVALPAPDAEVPAAPAAGPVETVGLAGPWTVAYADTPDARQDVALPHRWEDDPARADHSGAATHETTVDVAPERLDGRILLDLGPVRPPPARRPSPASGTCAGRRSARRPPRRWARSRRSW
jgi:hypothetical protein